MFSRHTILHPTIYFPISFMPLFLLFASITSPLPLLLQTLWFLFLFYSHFLPLFCTIVRHYLFLYFLYFLFFSLLSSPLLSSSALLSSPLLFSSSPLLLSTHQLTTESGTAEAPLRSTHVGLSHILDASCVIAGECSVAEKKQTCSVWRLHTKNELNMWAESDRRR